MTCLDGLTLRIIDDLAYGALIPHAHTTATIANIFRGEKQPAYTWMDAHLFEPNTKRKRPGLPITPSLLKALAAGCKTEQKVKANASSANNAGNGAEG